MDTSHPVKNLKSLYTNIDLPDIDVSQKVMDKISINSFKPRCIIKKRFVIAAAVIFILCSGFAAAMKIWELNDGNGNITLRLQEFIKGDEPIEQDSKYDEIYNKLEAGKAIAIFNNGSKSHMVTYIKPLKYDSLSMVREKSNLEFKTPAFLPEGYTFKEGSISYEPGAVPSFEEMQKEARAAGKDLITKDVEVTNNVTSLSLDYMKGVDVLRIGITRWGGIDLYSNLKNKEIEKIKVNGRDALYIAETNSQIRRIVLREEAGETEHSGSILKDGKTAETRTKYFIEYAISSGNGDINKEELVKIAESLS